MARLQAGLPVRLPHAVSAGLCAALAATLDGWTRRDAHEVTSLSAGPLIDALSAALAEAGLGRPGGVWALRHGPGAHGLPTAAGTGFLLDLTDGRSQDGGLLLFGEERVEGWRPQAGALTVFSADHPPVLTLVAPDARAPRLSVFGTLA